MTNCRRRTRCSADTRRRTVAGERGVLLVLVGETVVSTLTTATDGELLIDVVFYTCKEFVCAMFQGLLTVTGHLGVPIIEEVVFKSDGHQPSWRAYHRRSGIQVRHEVAG